MLELHVHQVVVTAAEMRAIEAKTVEQGDTWRALLLRAGAAVAEAAIAWLGPTGEQRVLILVGPGNNGGDALVVARHIADHGWPVRCYTWSRTDDQEDAWLRDPLRERRVKIRDLTEQNRADFEADLKWCTVIVDGIFGTGLRRDISGELVETISQAAQSQRPVIAVDIATGVDSDTGQICGAALPADFTVTLGHFKYGHFLPPGAALSGKIALGDIGLDAKISQQLASGQLLNDSAVARLLPERPNDANKGTFGKAMVVAGSINYIGAAALATEGAMRAGAGLVTLGCPGDLLPIMAVKLTECTFLPLPSDLGVLSQHATDKLKSALEGYKSLLIGCGIGKEKETSTFLRNLLTHAEPATPSEARPMGFAARAAAKAEQEKKEAALPPLVLDGDALNLLSEWEEWHTKLPQDTILTPHPGEMARLLGSTVEEVQKDRVKAATDTAARSKCVVVLKGAGTLIAAPNGKVYVSPFSNPALASAGTGDVLAGAIAGLLAQGLSPVDAACAGVYLHGMAGEILRAEYGPSGGLAGELPILLARAGRHLRENTSAERER